MMIMKQMTLTGLIVLLGMMLLVFPSMAALPISTIHQGNTIFLGEENLDVSAAVPSGTTIAWWASGGSIATDSPQSTFVVSDATNFYASPTQFGAFTGSWYILPTKTPAFTIAEQNLGIRVEDTTVGVDVTNNKWVYRGDVVGFRIDTNLNTISSQRGTPVLITIKVQSPDGGTYSSLVNTGGAPTYIVDMPVSTSPYSTGGIWDTGNAAYTAGTYTIWAECNVNRMKDNYPASGRTYTSQTSMKNQEQNPLMSVSVPTTSPAIPTITKTTTPKIPVTTILTTAPVTATTTIPATMLTISETNTTTPPTMVTATATHAPGFGGIIAILSVFVIAALVLKKQ
jgi:hypothetical protein